MGEVRRLLGERTAVINQIEQARLQWAQEQEVGGPALADRGVSAELSGRGGRAGRASASLWRGVTRAHATPHTSRSSAAVKGPC